MTIVLLFLGIDKWLTYASRSPYSYAFFLWKMVPSGQAAYMDSPVISGNWESLGWNVHVKSDTAVGWRQAWELIQTVLPFHAVTFRSGAAQRQSRAVLDVLDKCAHRLLYELKMEGLATGLDVHVEVLSPSPPSSCSNQLKVNGVHSRSTMAHVRPT